MCDLEGDKDDFRGMVRTNDGDVASDDMKARAFDAKRALADAGVYDVPDDARDVVGLANEILEGDY